MIIATVEKTREKKTQTLENSEMILAFTFAVVELLPAPRDVGGGSSGGGVGGGKSVGEKENL